MCFVDSDSKLKVAFLNEAPITKSSVEAELKKLEKPDPLPMPDPVHNKITRKIKLEPDGYLLYCLKEVLKNRCKIGKIKKKQITSDFTRINEEELDALIKAEKDKISPYLK